MEMKQTVVKIQRQLSKILQTQMQSQIGMALENPTMLMPLQFMKKMLICIQEGRQLCQIG